MGKLRIAIQRSLGVPTKQEFDLLKQRVDTLEKEAPGRRRELEMFENELKKAAAQTTLAISDVLTALKLKEQGYDQ